MKEKYLPIGSIILLKGAKKKLMINSYLVFPSSKKDKSKMYDYGGCTYPEGIIDSNYSMGFNHEDIEKIIFIGYQDEEQKKLNETLKKSEQDIRKIFEDAQS